MNESTLSNSSQFSKYNPFDKASLRQAHLHLKANSTNQGTVFSSPKKLCPCCGKNYDVVPFTFFQNTDDYSSMGLVYSSLF